jgi:hypothetical protein
MHPVEVPEALERWQDLMRAVDRADEPPKSPPMGREAIDAIGWYTLAVTDVSPEVLSSTFGRILHRPEETVMSTLERTFQKGQAEGEAKGRTETLMRQLHKRIGADREGRRREEETAANDPAQSVCPMSACSRVPGMRASAS